MLFKNLKNYADFDENENSKKIGLFVKGKGISFPATAYIRLLFSFDLIGDDESYSPYIINIDEINKVTEDIINENFNLDIIIIQRDVLKLDLAKLIIEKCQKLGIFIIYEIDDDLMNIDSSHPEFDYYKTVRNTVEYIIQNANVCTVSTKQLKEKLNYLNKNIYVIPNRLIKQWNAPSNVSKQQNIIKIGYMGTTSHSNDLNLIKKAIINVKNYFKNKNVNIVFELIGGTDEDLDFANKIEIPQGKAKYPLFVEWLKATVDWDIALAPLEDTFINNSKSALKYLEYSALNVPGIYSNVGPYKSKIIHEYNGLLVDNTTTSWENNIIKLIENKELQRKILTNSQNDIHENYLLEFSAKQWKGILNLAEFNLENIDKNSVDFNYNIIKNSYWFDEKYYSNKYPDIIKSNIDPLLHYVKYGYKENRDPNPEFSSEIYKKTFLLNDNTWNPLTHHILISKFRASQMIIPKENYDLNLKIIKESKLFDETFYLNNYPDIIKSNMDPVLHYVKYGYKENRNPNSEFSTLEYKNEFLSNNCWNPFTHYILIGRYDEFELTNKNQCIENNDTCISNYLDKINCISNLLSEFNVKKTLSIGLTNEIILTNIINYFSNDKLLYVLDNKNKISSLKKKLLKDNDNHDNIKHLKYESLITVPNLKDFDAILINNDPNWYSVFNELNSIKKNCLDFPLVFICHNKYPHKRRDSYIDPNNIPEEYKHDYYNKLPIKYEENNKIKHVMIDDGFYHAIYENTPKNGVLTAIEDFLNENESLSMFEINRLDGISLIYKNSKCEKIQKLLFEEKKFDFSYLDLFDQLTKNSLLLKQIDINEKKIKTQIDQINDIKNQVNLKETQLQKVKSELNTLNIENELNINLIKEKDEKLKIYKKIEDRLNQINNI